MFQATEYINWESGEKTTPYKDERLTKEQADKLTEVMKGGRVVDSVIVCEGGCMGLPDGFASVAFLGGYMMGIAPDGRAHT